MRSLLRAVAFFAALGLANARLPAEETNWQQFLGPRGNSHTENRGLPVKFGETENVKWKTPLPGKAWSSPVVWGNQVWLTNATADGKRLSVVCLAADTGQVLHDRQLWEIEKPAFCHPFNSYASCTPVIEEGRVYVHFGTYGTACLDTQTCRTLWERRDFPCDHYRGPGSSPIVFGNLLITHYDGYDLQYVVALDKQTGDTVWKVDREVKYGTDDGDIKKAFSTPSIVEIEGRPQLISPTSKAFLAYDPTTGKELWRVRHPDFSSTARPMFGHGLLFLNTGFGKASLWAVKTGGQGDVSETHVAWKVGKSIGSKPSQIVVDHLVYNVHDQGVASCLEAKTGAEVWSHRLGGNFTASPLYGDGKVYFFNEDGVCTVVAHGQEYQELAQNKFASGFMASAAVTGQALILRTKTDVYRIEE